MTSRFTHPPKTGDDGIWCEHVIEPLQNSGVDGSAPTPHVSQRPQQVFKRESRLQKIYDHLWSGSSIGDTIFLNHAGIFLEIESGHDVDGFAFPDRVDMNERSSENMK